MEDRYAVVDVLGVISRLWIWIGAGSMVMYLYVIECAHLSSALAHKVYLCCWKTAPSPQF